MKNNNLTQVCDVCVAPINPSLTKVWLESGVGVLGIQNVEIVEQESVNYSGDVRIVGDHWRRKKVGDKARAYDSEDVVDRYQSLKEQLTDAELRQLALRDEMGMLVASLAETVKLEVFPYKMFEFEGKVGSLTEIQGSDEKRVWVFRDVVDMLESRVAKFPDDDRSKAVLSSFKVSIVPHLTSMTEGETLVYFSPPASGQVLEGEYGFVYFLRKETDKDSGLSYFNSLSVKVDWESEEYFSNLERLGVEVQRDSYANDYWAITNNCKRFDKRDLERVVGEVLAGDERLEEGVGVWLNTQLSKYDKASDFVENRSQVLVGGIVGGVVHNLKMLVEKLQLEWIRREKPKLYEEIQFQIEKFGYAELMVACGLLEFGGGFGESLQAAMRGVGGVETMECVECPFCHKTVDAIVTSTKIRCPECAAEVDRS